MAQYNGLLSLYLEGLIATDQILQRAREQEPRIHAFVDLRVEPAPPPPPDSKLRGAPYGAKDIIDVAGYATTYGSRLYAGNMADTDAAIITLLRSLGGVMMGKTQTTSFAYFDPAPTRNPRNLAHTPGGSSSGSAAAVAAGMAPFAIGSQTQGSILRPASYCGVVGFKPTFGVLPLEGVMPFAPSLDTLGFFTQTALDMRLLWQTLGHAIPPYSPDTYAMVEFPVDPDMQETFRHSIQILGHYGCQVRRLQLPESFHRMAAAVPLIQNYEGARMHRDKYETHGAAIGVKLAALIREGLATSDETYSEALRACDTARTEMARIFDDYPVLLSPAAVGPPPQGLASTGDPRCNAPWTGLHVPAISIPMPAGEQLPMGLQLASAYGNDAFLLSTAAHLQALLDAGGPQA